MTLKIVTSNQFDKNKINIVVDKSDLKELIGLPIFESQ